MNDSPDELSPRPIPDQSEQDSGAAPLLVRVLRGEPVERTPVWIMRQAGRYLPEYRAVRTKHEFLEMCRTPELAAEVTLQPVRRFGMDAAIIFSDILLVLDAMGAGVWFDSDGPVVDHPVRCEADVRRLADVDPDRDLRFVADAIRATVAELPRGTAMLGFAGAPFTLLTYLMEGRGEHAHVTARAFLVREPALADDLLARLARAVAAQLEAQLDAGVHAVQLFDTWAGALPLHLWKRFAAPAARSVVEALRHRGVPVIYFARGSAALLHDLRDVGAAAYGIDWTCDIARARRVLGQEVVVQGNLDPAVLLTTPEHVREQAALILRAAGPHGHVLNLGHGVLPQTAPALVAEFVRAVTEMRAER
jgi:uroporphyrinogen decarboxylase